MKAKVIISVLLLVLIVTTASLMSTRLWKGVPEEGSNSLQSSVHIDEGMSVRQVASAFGLHPRVLKEPLGLKSPADLDKTLAELGLSAEQAAKRIVGTQAIGNEASSKNWMKILIKFALWLVFLGIMLRLMVKRAVSPQRRMLFLGVSVLIFGIILGSDPSPMGTVKDAIVLWGKDRVVFLPRLIAFAVFLFLTVFANKFICSWGCQFGVLQDLIFRMNRDVKDRQGLLPQARLPFVLTNTVRILFFFIFTLLAVLWTTDIIKPIDPFSIFNPSSIRTVGIAFIGLILISSVFVYRPWCHLFCPFGLVGWLAEHVSYYKVKVNYDTCIACKACAQTCPSTVMDAVLKQDRAIPDCFSCGSCIGACPTKSITFAGGARQKPPKGKFKDTKRSA
jgi:NAD-dependent dihydropyrimidine dehydrogenase PreA subunit